MTNIDLIGISLIHNRQQNTDEKKPRQLCEVS